jgi:hypothetical protein
MAQIGSFTRGENGIYTGEIWTLTLRVDPATRANLVEVCRLLKRRERFLLCCARTFLLNNFSDDCPWIEGKESCLQAAMQPACARRPERKFYLPAFHADALAGSTRC